MPTLYTTPLSANGRKALAVSRHLELSLDVRDVNVYAGEGRAPEYLAIHPLGKIPVLVDGDLTLWESNAIAIYLAEAYGGGRLWSADARRRADIARWLFWEAAHWQPAVVQVPGLAGLVGALLRPQDARPTLAEVEWGAPSLLPVARFLDEHLRGRAFLVADELSVADFSVAAMMTYARPSRFPFEAYPCIAEWYARVEALDAWRSTAVGPWA